MQNITVGEASFKNKWSIRQSSSTSADAALSRVFSIYKVCNILFAYFFLKKSGKTAQLPGNWFNRLKQRWPWGSLGMGHGGWSSSMWFLPGESGFQQLWLSILGGSKDANLWQFWIKCHQLMLHCNLVLLEMLVFNPHIFQVLRDFWAYGLLLRCWKRGFNVLFCFHFFQFGWLLLDLPLIQ